MSPRPRQPSKSSCSPEPWEPSIKCLLNGSTPHAHWDVVASPFSPTICARPMRAPAGSTKPCGFSVLYFRCLVRDAASCQGHQSKTRRRIIVQTIHRPPSAVGKDAHTCTRQVRYIRYARLQGAQCWHVLPTISVSLFLIPCLMILRPTVLRAIQTHGSSFV